MHLEDSNKDIIDNMRGKWIIEISEMAGFGKRENDWLKAFLSRATDRVRLSYGRRSQDYPRQSILIGSMNPSGDNSYFRDDTGNARYWPVACGDKIDVDGIVLTRNQLFAEAVDLYKKRLPLYLEGQIFELAEKEQNLRLGLDAWYYDVARLTQTLIETTTADILERLHIPNSQRGHYEQMRVGKIMKQLGWTKKRNQYGWYYVKGNGQLGGSEQDTANS
jgi:predicted P-loop ATPase